MRHDQGGARVRGVAPKTKKALREAIASGAEVELYTTSAFGGFHGFIETLPEGLSFVVVGPDPERKRSWYAAIERKSDGKVKIW